MTAFVAHLPLLSHEQTERVQRWARDRSVDAHIVVRDGSSELFAVFKETRNQKALQNLINTNLTNWSIDRPKFRRGWVEVMTLSDYLERAGPSSFLHALAKRTVQTVVDAVMKQFEQSAAGAQLDREQKITAMVLAVQLAATRNYHECVEASWHELSRPARLRREQRKIDEANRKKHQELEDRARRLRSCEERQRQQREEQARQEQQDPEYDLKRKRLYEEIKARLGGVMFCLPYDVSKIEKVEDIPGIDHLLARCQGHRSD